MRFRPFPRVCFRRAAAVAQTAAILACLACDRSASKGSRGTGGANGVTGPAALSAVPCGELDCMQYATPAAAFARVVASEPLVLAVGEAHAPKGAVAESAAKRFAEVLLPTIADRTSDLLLELMMPPAGCVDVTAEVREETAPVSERQAPADRDEYVAMGERARSLRVVPDTLRPTCDDMATIQKTGDGAVAASLELIARLTQRQAERLVDRDARSDGDVGKMVVVYGGMLHNVLAPRREAAAWSYAPALDEYVRGRIVTLDLVVPEFIGLDASWSSLPWWPHYDKSRLGTKTTLFRTGPKSYVIVFPVSHG